MVEVLRSDTNQYYSFKCGEVYCLTSTTYKVTCCICGQKMNYDKFPQHFQNEHISKTGDQKSSLTADAESSILQEKIDNFELIKRENDTRDINKFKVVEDTIEDEIPCDIKELQLSRNKTCVADIDYSMSIPKTCSTSNDLKDEEKSGTDSDNCSKSDDSVENDNLEKVNKKATKNIELFTCNICERSYKLKRGLEQHLRLKHDPTRPKLKPQLKHKCEICGHMFRSQHHLNGHKWKHIEIKCDICGKPFSQPGDMMRHKIRHTGIKEYKCNECEMSFYTKKELSAHLLRHTKIMPIICEICGRPCRDRGVLTAHMRRHTGERPAKCDVCGKSFYSFYDLNIHAVIHTSERPFACDICSATFQRKKSLRIHKKLHSDIKKYPCKVCGRAFAQSCGLNSHMRVHNPVKEKNTSVLKRKTDIVAFEAVANCSADAHTDLIEEADDGFEADLNNHTDAHGNANGNINDVGIDNIVCDEIAIKDITISNFNNSNVLIVENSDIYFNTVLEC